MLSLKGLTRTISLAVALSAVLMASAGQASAATEFGNRCTGVSGSAGATFTSLTDSKLVAPSTGVITRWGMHFPAPGAFPVAMLLLRGSDVNQTVVGRSASETAATVGAIEFATRVAVTTGDRLAISGTGIYCAGTPTDELRVVATPTIPDVGAALTFGAATPNLLTDIWARIEADADLDGFGDETQDGCPQSAAIQTACPVPVIGAVKVAAVGGFRAALTTSVAANVSIAGSVKLPKSKGKRARTLRFKGKTVSTGPGILKTISIRWPKSLNAALNKLDSSKSLKVTITLTADGIVTDGVKKFTVRLKGRA